MSRRGGIPKREVLPDPLYNSQLVTKFVNVLMRDGKKSTAERLLYKAKRGVGPDGRRRGLRTLGRLLESLEGADPPLITDAVVVPDDARGRGLKAIEDTLDARLCAWIASVWSRFGTDRVRLFGGAETGHIAVPVGAFVD